MIRLNAFFRIKESADLAKVLELGNELVIKSRNDKGNIAYDLFRSSTDGRVFMFCETWASQAELDEHAASVHFTQIVPMLESMTENGLKLERFEF